jgi:hypothetical protein
MNSTIRIHKSTTKMEEKDSMEHSILETLSEEELALLIAIGNLNWKLELIDKRFLHVTTEEYRDLVERFLSKKRELVNFRRRGATLATATVAEPAQQQEAA